LRILSNDSNHALKGVTLYLTMNEARELHSSLESLMDSGVHVNHSHINDVEYTHEITVVIYCENDFNGFNQRSIKLIQEDS